MEKNKPLVCNSNSHHHIDYGMPIVANKSTDYRTTTGTSHGFAPEKPTDYDCRVKVHLRNDWKYNDVAVKDATFQTSNRFDYPTKYPQTKICDGFRKAPRKDQNYTRNTQEKMFANPPMPMVPKISEMKDNYRMNYFNNSTTREVVEPPAITAICPVQGLGRDEQPPVRPENRGFYKWLDPYLTTNTSTHIQFSKNQCKDAKTDLPTFYNIGAYAKWTGFDGNLPPASGNKTIIDPYTFKNQLPNRIVPKKVDRVPNFGATTEYSQNYQVNSKSNLSPYIEDGLGVQFEDSLSKPSIWQDLAAPGMYSTEYSQIGTGKSSRTMIPVDVTKTEIFHKPCSYKLTDNYTRL